MHRRDAFRAEKILQDRLFKNPKIEVIWDTGSTRSLGSDNPLKVSGVAAQERQDRRDYRNAGSTASSSPSAPRRRPSCSRASSR